MPIPNYQTYMRPLLAELTGGIKKKLPGLVSAISEKFKFTPEQLAARIPNISRLTKKVKASVSTFHGGV